MVERRSFLDQFVTRPFRPLWPRIDTTCCADPELLAMSQKA
jgi:hypothetical protein